MHPSLTYYSSHSKIDSLQSEEHCKTFIESYHIIPSRLIMSHLLQNVTHQLITCLKHPRYKIGLSWRCSKRKDRINNYFGSINPLKNTFFENAKISFQDVSFFFFWKISILTWRTVKKIVENTLRLWPLGYYVIEKWEHDFVNEKKRKCRSNIISLFSHTWRSFKSSRRLLWRKN